MACEHSQWHTIDEVANTWLFSLLRLEFGLQQRISFQWQSSAHSCRAALSLRAI